MIPNFKQLRDYQQNDVNLVYEDFEKNKAEGTYQRILVPSPVGSGKTIISAAITHRLHTQSNEPLVVIVVPRLKIVSQAIAEFQDYFLQFPGYKPIMATFASESVKGVQQSTGSEIIDIVATNFPCYRIIFTTYNSVYKLFDYLPISILLLDEVHCCRIHWEKLNQCHLIGFTATPSSSLVKILKPAFERTFGWAVENNYAVDYEIILLAKMSDNNLESKADLNLSMIDTILERNENQKLLVVSTKKADAGKISRDLSQLGHLAHCITAEVPGQRRNNYEKRKLRKVTLV